MYGRVVIGAWTGSSQQTHYRSVRGGTVMFPILRRRRKQVQPLRARNSQKLRTVKRAGRRYLDVPYALPKDLEELNRLERGQTRRISPPFSTSFLRSGNAITPVCGSLSFGTRRRDKH